MALNAQNREERPWGSFEVIGEFKTGDTEVVIKKITVKPGKRLSYQMHNLRAEHWHIVAGMGSVTLNDKDRTVRVGDSVDISIGARHRIANNGEDDLVFVEIATGIFDEHDIVRLADDFGRDR